MAKAQRRLTRGWGFTLAELMVAVLIMGTLAAMLVPMLQSYVTRGRLAMAKQSLVSLGKSMHRFHDDTGGWPWQNNIWLPTNSSPVQPVQFGALDTAMYMNPVSANPRLPVCNQTSGPLGTHCWGGPYLNMGMSMADPAMKDPWGNPYYYAYLQPGPNAPSGLVVIWSAGPNGISETVGLSSQLARGLPTVQPSDDIMVVVGSAY